MFFRIPKRYEQHSVEKEPMKTTVSFIADIKDKDGMRNYPPYVTSYSSQGFNIKGIKVFGSVALLPTIFYHWRVSSFVCECYHYFIHDYWQQCLNKLIYVEN